MFSYYKDKKNGQQFFIILDNQENSNIQPLKLGYGECSKPWCECREYEDPGYGDLCDNCGHKYSDHS